MSFENRDCLGNVMKIKELNLRNFRGFKELDIKFPSSNLAVFIGINGAGKSSILDAIAMFLSDFILNLIQKEDNVGIEFLFTNNDINIVNYDYDIHNNITIESDTFDSIIPFERISWNISYSDPINGFEAYHLREVADMIFKESDIDKLEEYIETIQGKLKKNQFLNLPILVYYQTNRAILKDRFNQKNKRVTLPNQFFAYENAFTKNVTNLSDFVSWFRFEEDLENEMKIKQKDFNAINKNLEVIRKAITTFLNQFPACEFSDLHIERRSQDKNFSFHSAEESSLVIKKNGHDLKIDQLSAGEQIVLMMVSDIARRLAIANPSLPDPLQGKGIVLIDEIELHLHPQWQRQIIPCLLHTFPNIQFIITTHSPQVLGNVDKEEVFILEDFKIVEKTPHTKGRDSNSVLYELLGVEERPKEYKDKLNQLYRLIDDEKFDEAKEILSELTEKFGEHDTEIVRANMHLNLAEEDMNEIHQKG